MVPSALARRTRRLARAGVLLSIPLLAACRRDAGDAPHADAREAQTGFRGVTLGRPIARPSFTLQDTDGRPFDFVRETEGRVALLFFGYTHCPDVCPLHMANIAAVLAKMPYDERQQVRTVFVTTDPQRDTPQVIRAWLDQFDTSFVGLTGDAETVDRLQLALGLRPAQREPMPGATDSSAYLVGHAAQVIAFGTDGPARLLYPFGTRQEDWANDLPRLARGDIAAAPAIEATVVPAESAPVEFRAGPLVVSRVVIPAPPSPDNTALYLTVRNEGAGADTLVGIMTDAAGAVVLHGYADPGRMIPLEAGLAVPAGGSARLAPGGAHGMLAPLMRPLAAGDLVPVSLRFTHGGVVNVRATVVPYGEVERALAAPVDTGRRR
jgi:protein SCO1/2